MHANKVMKPYQHSSIFYATDERPPFIMEILENRSSYNMPYFRLFLLRREFFMEYIWAAHVKLSDDHINTFLKFFILQFIYIFHREMRRSSCLNISWKKMMKIRWKWGKIWDNIRIRIWKREEKMLEQWWGWIINSSK